MKRLKFSWKINWLAIPLFLGLALYFQNCSNSSGLSPSPTQNTNNPKETNTTPATKIIISETNIDKSSGETFSINASAVDESESVVSEFNYTATIEIFDTTPSPPGITYTPLQICAQNLKFTNGTLSATLSVINNNLGKDISGKIKISSVDLPTVTTTNFVIRAQKDSQFQETNLSGSAPSPRSKSAAIYDEDHQKIILFGGREIIEYIGYVQDGNPLNDLWQIDLSNTTPNWTKLSPSSSPSARFGHSLVLDKVNNRILLFGGNDSINSLSDLWSLDLSNMNWSQLNPENNPVQARAEHQTAFDKTNGLMFLTGGYEGVLNDISTVNIFKNFPSPDGKWLSTPQAFPTNPNQSIDFIYVKNGGITFYNPFFPEYLITAQDPACNAIGSGVPYLCPSGKEYSSAFDKANKKVWLITTQALTAPPVVPNQSSTQYKPFLKVFNRSVPLKQSCPM